MGKKAQKTIHGCMQFLMEIERDIDVLGTNFDKVGHHVNYDRVSEIYYKVKSAHIALSQGELPQLTREITPF